MWGCCRLYVYICFEIGKMENVTLLLLGSRLNMGTNPLQYNICSISQNKETPVLASHSQSAAFISSRAAGK